MPLSRSGLAAIASVSTFALTALLVACANGGDQPVELLEDPSNSTTDKSGDAGESTVLPGDEDPGATSTEDAGEELPQDLSSDAIDSGAPDESQDSGSADASTLPASCKVSPPSNVCGVPDQCGCAANQTCEVTGTDGTSSCIAAGSVKLGRACAKSTDCQAGLSCVDGACRPYCANPDGACTGAGLGVCFAPQDDQGKTTPNKSYCTIECDRLNPTTACGTNNCVWFAGDNLADCIEAGAGGQTASCSALVDCKPGYQCENHPDYGPECEQWCELGKAGGCPNGFTCEDVFNAASGTGAKLGLCRD